MLLKMMEVSGAYLKSDIGIVIDGCIQVWVLYVKEIENLDYATEFVFIDAISTGKQVFNGMHRSVGAEFIPCVVVFRSYILKV